MNSPLFIKPLNCSKGLTGSPIRGLGIPNGTLKGLIIGNCWRKGKFIGFGPGSIFFGRDSISTFFLGESSIFSTSSDFIEWHFPFLIFFILRISASILSLEGSFIICFLMRLWNLFFTELRLRPSKDADMLVHFLFNLMNCSSNFRSSCWLQEPLRLQY